MGDAARKIEPEIEERSRRHPRACVSLTIGLTSEHNFWSGITLNVSEGGVFVATHHDVPVGTVLSLSIWLPRCAVPVVALGEVRWTRPYGGEDGEPPGFGVRFVDVAPDALREIASFVQSVRDPLYFEEG